jgi:hypothetical protein
MRQALFMLMSLLALVVPCEAASKIEHVFVVVMENKDAFKKSVLSSAYIYGNGRHAPYINETLIPNAARASHFIDELPDEKSEPHYVLMEAGTAHFPDATFQCDADPLKHCTRSDEQNWTASRDHLVAQLETAGLSWMVYAEGIDARSTGVCPVRSSGLYAAKHVPFVFFSDVAGSPPSRENTACAQHFRDLPDVELDLAGGSVANYVFIVPDLCNDMHGARKCEDENAVRTGDDFLKSLLPKLIQWSEANRGLVMVAWDEGHDTLKIPFILAGPGVKKNYESSVRYSHRSMIRTVERIFGLPVLETVKDSNDFADMFEPGAYP